MRLRFHFAAFGAVILVLPAAGQVLTEHGAALAGSAVGSASGKAVSNGVTKIFGALDSAAGKAAKGTEDSRPAAKAPAHSGTAPESAPDFAAPSVGSGAAPPRTASVRRALNRPAPAATYVAAQPPTPVKEPTLADLRSVQVGSSGDDLVKTLGAPSSTITIPEDGHLIQTLRYSAQGQLLGVVRLDNGQVTGVETVASN
jgi:hypothetical protein